MVQMSGRTMESDAAGACKLPLLEALLAEHGTSLRRTERNGGVLAACGARSLCFDPLTRCRSSAGPVSPFRLARLAPLGLVLELFVGKEQLLSRCPDKLRPAVHTP